MQIFILSYHFPYLYRLRWKFFFFFFSWETTLSAKLWHTEHSHGLHSSNSCRPSHHRGCGGWGAQGSSKKLSWQSQSGFRAAEWPEEVPTAFRADAGTNKTQTYEVKLRSSFPAFSNTKMKWWWIKKGELGEWSYQLHTTTSNPVPLNPWPTLSPSEVVTIFQGFSIIWAGTCHCYSASLWTEEIILKCDLWLDVAWLAGERSPSA